MTIEEARVLMGTQDEVEVRRSGATWAGKVVGIMEHPCLIIEGETGVRYTVAIEGAAATPRGEFQQQQEES